MAPTSPIKRVTRARAAAKKPTDDMMNAPPKKAPAAKATAARKSKAVGMDDTPAAVDKPAKKTTTAEASTTLAAAPRRRVKVTPLAPAAIEKEETSELLPEPTAAPKNTTRPRKIASKAETKVTKTSDTVAPVTRTRNAATKIPKEDEDAKAASRPRGRPKKTLVAQSQPENEKPARQTRKRADSAIISTKPTSSSVTKAATMQKKTVTFQDLPDSDKENLPMPTRRGAGKKESIAAAATGLRARPVRKPVTRNTRQKPTTSMDKPEAKASRALTPKKITQVARSSSISDSEEDELQGGKTPIRDLSQSPKRAQILARSPSPVKKLDFTQSLSANSPTKANLMSPPRRLPQSPFKNSLKESPKRSEGVSIFPALTSMMSTSVANNLGSQQDSALQQSPKRGVADNSIFSQSVMKMKQSPHKPFLLQSPARRLFSPAKQNFRSAHEEDVVTDTAISCSFMSSRSPERSVKLQSISDEELALGRRQEIDFDESVLNIRSPVKIAKSAPQTEAISTEERIPIFEVDEDLMEEPTPVEPSLIAERDVVEEMDVDQNDAMEGVEDLPPILDLDSTSEQLPLTGNAADYMLNSYTLRPEEESSEDELQAEETPYRPLFAGRPSLSGNAIRAGMLNGLSGMARSSLGFTPLAAQLSGWAASSPEKQGGRSGQQQSMFSPLAAQHIPGEVQIGRQPTPTKRKSVGARQSIGLRKSITARTSMAVSSVEDSDVPSHFADEMAARELEEEIEDLHSISPEAVNLHEVDAPFTHENAHGPEQLSEHDEVAGLDGSNYVGNHSEPLDDEDVDDLTTDLIQDKALTDTAQLDFAAIAQEAEQLAPSVDESQHSSNSSEYGDENTVIVTRQTAPEYSAENAIPEANSDAEQPVLLEEATLFALEGNHSKNPIATPVRPNLALPRFANTVVSKIPLRPEGEISPLKVTRKRSRSLSAGPGSSKKPLLELSGAQLPKSNTVISFSPERNQQSPSRSAGFSTPGQTSFAIDDFGDSTLDGIILPDSEHDVDEDSVLLPTPYSLKSNRIRSSVATPNRSPLKVIGGGVLHGAMVYVDVHTTEGADASGIFVDLLTQMGAKCVREWKWNPRASISVSAEDAENAFTPGKIGITHVVYKDGGKRTLEKVRDANCAVCCVGVGWVLDCEREGKWLDESNYAVDPAILPRGGSRRRKSMEPKALINANGSLSATRGRSISAEMTREMREELVNTPIRQPLFPIEQPTVHVTSASDEDEGPGSPESGFSTSAAATPTGYVKYDPSTSMSPTTPYLMSKGSKLVQQTCPPKQSQQGLFEGLGSGFPVSGRIEDQPDESLRAKLEAARRKTMNWRPRVASPLGK